jgi:hypothetical protein
MKTVDNTRHLMQIARRKNITKVKPSMRIYNRIQSKKEYLN